MNTFSSLFMDAKKMTRIPQRLAENQIVEEKFDGMRCLLKEGILISKRGNRVSDAFPELKKEIEMISKSGSIFDGELVVFQKGICDFKMIQTRRNLQNNFKVKNMAERFPATLMIFDVLQWEGESVTNQLLLDRKKILQDISYLGDNGKFIKVVPYFNDLQILLKKDIEGIVIKNTAESYMGKSGRWKKFRFEEEKTVKVVKVEDHPAGCLLITEEGWRINCAGKHNSETARSLMNEGEFGVEISYYEETEKGELRFARFKRFVGGD